MYDGSITSFIKVNAPGVYGVEVNTDCQSVKQDIEVVPGDVCKDDIFTPTVFSPNDDGINDTWSIYSADPDAALVSLSILDRWGGLIFYRANTSLNDSSVQWDGRMKEKDMGEGVYVFIAEVKLSNGDSRKIKGDITLIR